MLHRSCHKATPLGFLGEQVHPQPANGTPTCQTKEAAPFDPYGYSKLANGTPTWQTTKAALSDLLPIRRVERPAAIRLSSARRPAPDTEE
jgi:hypothetical protein